MERFVIQDYNFRHDYVVKLLDDIGVPYDDYSIGDQFFGYQLEAEYRWFLDELMQRSKAGIMLSKITDGGGYHVYVTQYCRFGQR